MGEIIYAGDRFGDKSNVIPKMITPKREKDNVIVLTEADPNWGKYASEYEVWQRLKIGLDDNNKRPD